MENVKEDIHKFFKGDIEDSPETLEKYSRDASLFYVRPKVVLFPKDSEDVEKLVSFVSEKRKAGEDIHIVPRSGGTDMTGGPLSTSIVIEFTRYMNHLKEFSGDTATVEPGMYYRDFDKETKKHGFILPSYPASREICAVGGMVANNAGGEKNLRYGKTEKYVESLTVVLRDGKSYVFRALSLEELAEKEKEEGLEGEILRGMHHLIEGHYDVLEKARPDVSKNSSGYYLWNVYDKEKNIFDISKVIVGSQGTLGIITNITFRLVRPKPYSSVVVLFLKDISNLAQLITYVLSYNPESFESFDDHTFKLAVKFFPEFAKKMGSNFFKLAFLFLPEMWRVITGGIPRLVLLAEFTGDTQEEAFEKAQQAEKGIRQKFNVGTKMAKNAAAAEKYWLMRRESFNLLRHRIRGLRTAPFIDDLVVSPEYLPEFLPKLDKILADYHSMIYTIAGHAGDGNFHIIPLMDPHDPNLKNTIREVADRVYALVLEYHGSISGEHNDGFIRGPYVRTMFGDEVYRLFEETKKIFDPHGIFNPGKKIGVSQDAILNFIDTKEPSEA